MLTEPSPRVGDNEDDGGEEGDRPDDMEEHETKCVHCDVGCTCKKNGNCKCVEQYCKWCTNGCHGSKK